MPQSTLLARTKIFQFARKVGYEIMHILILGGTGLISREIAKTLLSQGHMVTLFNRGIQKIEFAGDIHFVQGDRFDLGDFTKKMKSLEPDVVIDMICFNQEDARQTHDAFAGRVKQIIYTSSVAAYKRPYKAFPMREETEDYCDSPDFPYGYHKAQMEKYLREKTGESSTAITIIRPSLTFGPGGTNMGVLRQNANIPYRIKNGKPLILFGDGTVSWSFTFAPDLAQAYVLSCMNSATFNDFFHVANSSICMWKDLYETIGKLLNRSVEYRYVPSAVLASADPALFLHLEMEKKYASIFDCSKFSQAVPEFQIHYSLEKGLEMMLDWWESENIPVDIEKDKLEDLICGQCELFEKNFTSTVQLHRFVSS